MPAPRRPGPTVVPARLLSDEQLAREVEAGREAAFTTLFGRHHQSLYRYCRSLVGNEQDAQDALQTSLTKALLALRAGRRNAPLRPWLFRIAHNESLTLVRSRRTAAELPDELATTRDTPELVEVSERFQTLLGDLRELAESQRTALVLRELSGLSHEEIAEVLGVSPGAAKQTILEARRSLQEFAEGRSLDCPHVQELLSARDRRTLRGRRVKAHLRACPTCASFAQAIADRQAQMLVLWPALPAAAAGGLLTKLTGTASPHAGGGLGSATVGAAAKGLGATIPLKAAAVGLVAVATVTTGALTVLHPTTPRRAPAAIHTLQARGPAGSSHQRADGGADVTAHRLRASAIKAAAGPRQTRIRVSASATRPSGTSAHSPGLTSASHGNAASHASQAPAAAARRAGAQPSVAHHGGANVGSTHTQRRHATSAPAAARKHEKTHLHHRTRAPVSHPAGSKHQHPKAPSKSTTTQATATTTTAAPSSPAASSAHGNAPGTASPHTNTNGGATTP